MDTTAALRQDLAAALKARDRARAGVLRTLLSAVANAEAQPADSSMQADEGPIAGAVTGLGAAEVDRRQLTAADVRAVIAGEHAERLRAAADLDAHGATDAAEALRVEARLVASYLGG